MLLSYNDRFPDFPISVSATPIPCKSVAYKLQLSFVETSLKELRIFVAAEGWEPFSEWFSSLDDRKVRAKIRVRLDRVSLGNFGDCRGVGEGGTGTAYRLRPRISCVSWARRWNDRLAPLWG